MITTFINVLFLLFFNAGPTPVAGMNGTTAAFMSHADTQAASLGMIRSSNVVARSQGR